MARPTKRTPEVEQRLLTALRAGNTIAAACRYAGITTETYGQWQRRFPAFSDAVTRAEAESEVALVAYIRAAATSDWRASLALLERRFPDTWARRERLDLDVYIRRRATELGMDPEHAIAAVKPRVQALIA